MEFQNLQKKIDPKHTALIVIDMQNDFCAEGGHLHRQDGHVEQLQAIVPALRKAINQARSVGVRIIFVRSDYTEHYLHEPLKEQFGEARFTLGRHLGGRFLPSEGPEEGDPDYRQTHLRCLSRDRA